MSKQKSVIEQERQSEREKEKGGWERRKEEGEKEERKDMKSGEEGERKKEERDTERKIPKHPGINDGQGLQVRPMCSQG